MNRRGERIMAVNEFHDVDNLSSQDFELFVKELFEKSGWTDAEITKPGKEYKHGDGGVDIFASKSGRRFAIEVKKRDIKNRVNINALNQLVTGADLANVQNKILVTNSYFTSEVQERALRLGVELVDREELQNLWVKKHSEIGREIKPRNYQASVIKECLEKYNSGKSKLLIEMATGLGKTYTVALLIKEILKQSTERRKVIFIAHQVEILLQSATAFKNVLGWGAHTFSACFGGSAPEPTDFVFATFDTVYSHIGDINKHSFDYVIVDEAHHTPANTYSAVVKHFCPELLIGLTATPYRMDNKSVVDFFGGLDGHIGKYDLPWALKHKKLAFPKYFVLLDDLDQNKIDNLEQGLSITDIDKRLFLHKKDEEVVRIIEETVRQKSIENLKGIVFCRNISHMQHLLGFFEPGTAICVHSKMNDNERRENIRRFREGDFKYVLVCDLFNEGIDIPEANLLVFMRYTGSRTVWLQQLGRGLRKTPNKEYVHVMDFVGSLERLYEVQDLSNTVRKLKVNPNDLDDVYEPSDKKSVVHDGTLEVHYSKAATKVLKLIEENQYRLKTRERLIEQIRQYRETRNEIPKINCLDSVLDDVSLDQIATLFDSYFGYLKAAFGDGFDVGEMKRRIYNCAQRFADDRNVRPSEKAVSLNFQYNALLEFTENEVSQFMQDMEISIRQIDKDEKQKEASNGKVKEDQSKQSLLEQYQGKIFNRRDIQILSVRQQEEIKTNFHSFSLFLKRLNDLRHSD